MRSKYIGSFIKINIFLLELKGDFLNDGGSNNTDGDVIGPAASYNFNVHGFLNA
jgi:hypothetical protein